MNWQCQFQFQMTSQCHFQMNWQWHTMPFQKDFGLFKMSRQCFRMTRKGHNKMSAFWKCIDCHLKLTRHCHLYMTWQCRFQNIFHNILTMPLLKKRFNATSQMTQISFLKWICNAIFLAHFWLDYQNDSTPFQCQTTTGWEAVVQFRIWSVRSVVAPTQNQEDYARGFRRRQEEM